MADVSVEARVTKKLDLLKAILLGYPECPAIRDGLRAVKSLRSTLSVNNQERAAGTVGVSDDKTCGMLSMAIGIIQSQRRHAFYTDDSPIAKFVVEAAEHLKDWPLAATSTTPVDEVLLRPVTNRCPKCVGLSCLCDGSCSTPPPGAAVKAEPVQHLPGACCMQGVCAQSTPHPSTAEPVDPAYPFYELKFIMRVLSHKGGAPKQDWDTAYGMAREIFVRWHKDRQSTAEGQTNEQGRAAEGAVPEQSFEELAQMERETMGDPDKRTGIYADFDPLDVPLPCDITVGHVTIRKGAPLRLLVARMQTLYDMSQPSASPVAVPVDDQNLMDEQHLRYCDRNIEASQAKGDADGVSFWHQWKAEYQRRIAAAPAIHEGGEHA